MAYSESKRKFNKSFVSNADENDIAMESSPLELVRNALLKLRDYHTGNDSETLPAVSTMLQVRIRIADCHIID